MLIVTPEVTSVNRYICYIFESVTFKSVKEKNQSVKNVKSVECYILNVTFNAFNGLNGQFFCFNCIIVLLWAQKEFVRNLTKYPLGGKSALTSN